RLDRGRLAALVFDDPDALRRLNAITHPRIAQRSTELIAQAPTGAVVVYDMALLVEQGAEALSGWDHIVVVDCPDDVRLDRVVERGMDIEDARRRMASQASREERLSVADTVIDNSGDLSSLSRQVDRLWELLRGAGA
ncbi:MAG: dephospho-CoA kinase, partial [Candidatus Nanopelagicales bacterium]